MNTTISYEDAKKLTAWYTKNKRPLPWRDTGNPIDVWISEIMLQQTRIEAVKDKFIAFRNELPDISAIAACSEDRMMCLWEGLGYYSRARNIRKCAQVLLKEYNGALPADRTALLSLPGIGPYTSGAISSIAFGIAAPAVDGNVLRVLSRYTGSEADVKDPAVRKNFESQILSLFEKESSSEFVSAFNQGLMELGETLCIPNGTPACEKCPFHDHCLAYLESKTDRIPVRSHTTKRKIVQRTLLIIRDGDKFLLRKRPDKGLLASLYEFPGVDSWINANEAFACVKEFSLQPIRIAHLPNAKHVFSHIEWHMHAYEIRVEECEIPLSEDLLLLTKKELQNFAVPSAFKAYVEWYSLRD